MWQPDSACRDAIFFFDELWSRKSCTLVRASLVIVIVYNVYNCMQLMQGSEGNRFRDHETITVSYLLEMQLRQGSKNSKKHKSSKTESFKQALKKYLIHNCKNSIDLNATHYYCEENFLARLFLKKMPYESYYTTSNITVKLKC